MSNAHSVAGARRRHGFRITQPGAGPIEPSLQEIPDQGLSLAAVNRRRAELWMISVVLVMTVTVAIALFALSPALLPQALGSQDMSTWVVGVLVGSLTLAFLIYVWEKERSFRRVTHLLMEERVHSTALAHRVSEMARLSEVGKAVNSALEQKQVFETILASALQLLGGSEGSIALLGPEGQLHAVAYKDLRGGQGERAATRVGDGHAREVVARRKPILVDTSDDPFAAPESTMSAPLIRNGEVLGVLNVSATSGLRRFREGDLEALGFFAEHAAIAIGNARLFDAERETIARLEELDQLKSDFVATVSHELRTPLTAIIGAAKAVARRGPDMEAAQHETFMNMIQRQADRLLRLVQDVLTASRMEGGTLQLRRDLVDLREVVDGVVADLAHTVSGEGRKTIVSAEPERPQTWGDRVALEQIVTNLVDNALKYSEGDVRVGIEQTASESVIEVTDEGAGISSEELATIFERFRQVGPSSTRTQGGFGLGLFIVKNLVEAHNGSIEVASEVGAGTRFAVRLPRRATSGPNE
jgi:signal transduction histidine kinase